MSQRRPIVGGNWKMNTDQASAGALAAACSDLAGECEVVVFPPFPYLLLAAEKLESSGVALGAQDAYFEPDGAYTGEVSIAMLADCGVEYAIAGHSERRHVLGENDELVNLKCRAILDGGLHAVLCVGETEGQRDAGQTERVVVDQLVAGLRGVDEPSMGRTVIAYEPVWAIGTGKTASADDAQAVHQVIRRTIGDLYGDAVAGATRIQYGGSVKPGNAAGLFEKNDIDGFLVGGASLAAEDFEAIVAAAVPSGAQAGQGS